MIVRTPIGFYQTSGAAAIAPAAIAGISATVSAGVIVARVSTSTIRATIPSGTIRATVRC